MTLNDIISEYKEKPTKELFADIIAFFTPLLNKIISAYSKEQQEDLFNICIVTLPKAINAYDSTKGSKVTSYICNYCKGTIQRYINKQKRETIIEYDDYIRIEATPTNIDLEIEIAELLLQNLSPLEIKIIRLKYGFNGNKVHTFQEINAILNIRSSFYYHNLAIQKLRETEYIKNFHN